MKWILIIFVGVGISFSQVDFSGYVEGEFDLLYLQKSSFTYGYIKLKAETEFNIHENGKFKSAVYYKTLWSNTQISINEFIPISLDADYNENFLPPDSLHIDVAFYQFSNNVLNCTIGRQPITFGGGYVWNPVNPFIAKDMTDPTYEIPGVDVLRIDYFLNDLEIEGIISLDSIHTYQNFLVSTNFSLLNHDVSFIYSDMDSQESFSFYSIGEISSIGVWTEFLTPIYNSNPSYVLGCDYTFNNGLYWMNEYFHHDTGLNFYGEYNQEEFIGYVFSNPIALAKDYFFSMIQFPILDYTSVSISQISNLTDQSGMINLQLDYSPMDDVDLTFGAFGFLGESNTEFGVFNSGLRFRMRYYY